MDKALTVLLGGFSNGTVVYRYELNLSHRHITGRWTSLHPLLKICVALNAPEPSHAPAKWWLSLPEGADRGWLLAGSPIWPTF
jgi:hypothetical protein